MNDKCKCGKEKYIGAKLCDDCRVKNLRYDKSKGTFEEQLFRALIKCVPVEILKKI